MSARLPVARRLRCRGSSRCRPLFLLFLLLRSGWGTRSGGGACLSRRSCCPGGAPNSGNSRAAFPSDAWPKMSAGLDAEAAAPALRDAGFLLPQRHLAGRHTRMERVGLGHPVRVHALVEAILTGHRTRDELARAEAEDAG
jgi:hypothetical protein